MARVVVDVMLKPEILDPQGKAVLGALPRLGFEGVTEVRQGKRFELEIEEVLLTHEAVSLAAVIGVPNERHGEEIKAFVILNEGAELTPDELVAWSREQMAAYKYPRIVAFVDSLPMTATCKILKRELVD